MPNCCSCRGWLEYDSPSAECDVCGREWGLCADCSQRHSDVDCPAADCRNVKVLGSFVPSRCMLHDLPLDVFDATAKEFICIKCCSSRNGHKFQRPQSAVGHAPTQAPTLVVFDDSEGGGGEHSGRIRP